VPRGQKRKESRIDLFVFLLWGFCCTFFSCLHWHFRLLIFLHCVVGIEVGRSSRLSLLLSTAHSNGRSLRRDTQIVSCRCRSHRPFQSNCQPLLFSFTRCRRRRLGNLSLSCDTVIASDQPGLNFVAESLHRRLCPSQTWSRK
jgi:hypothetical protein